MEEQALLTVRRDKLCGEDGEGCEDGLHFEVRGQEPGVCLPLQVGFILSDQRTSCAVRSLAQAYRLHTDLYCVVSQCRVRDPEYTRGNRSTVDLCYQSAASSAC